VLLISADLEELIGLSDTIHVILRGRLTGTFDPDTVSAEDLGAAMTGASATAGSPPPDPTPDAKDSTHMTDATGATDSEEGR